MTTSGPRPYHHGDLRAALLERGVELARSGGPAAVQLRDAARRAGVSHNAGYRHFANREDYLAAVADRGMGELADAMRTALRAVPAGLDAAASARARLSAIGTAYLRFALAEPGLFRTAFVGRDPAAVAPADPRRPGEEGPYELLVHAIDELATVGVLSPERRDHSEVVAWSAVHGLAVLLLDGPLRGASDLDVEALWGRVDGAVLRGL